MKKGHVISFVFFVLLGLSSCVSKKNYTRLQSEKDISAKEYEKSISGFRKQGDSLRLVLVQKDSLIDSLNFRLAELQKKEKTKPASSTIVAKKSSLSKVEEYEKKAVFIYNFTKFIEWPMEYNGTDFVIGVVGEQYQINQLMMFMTDKKTFGKKIVVKEYVRGAKYNVVFVSSSKAGSIGAIKEQVKKNKTVLISDDDIGAHISFLIDDDKIRYIVNKASIEKLGLKVAAELMRYSG